MRAKAELSLEECKAVYGRWRDLFSQGGLDAEIEAARRELGLMSQLRLMEDVIFSAPVELLGNTVATHHDEAVRREAGLWLDRVRRLREFEQARQREWAEYLRQLINGEPMVDVVYGVSDHEQEEAHKKS